MQASAEMMVGYVVGLILYMAIVLWIGLRQRAKRATELHVGERQYSTFSVAMGLLAVSYGAFVFTSFIGLGWLFGWGAMWVGVPGILSAWSWGTFLGPRLRYKTSEDVKAGIQSSVTSADWFTWMYGESLRIPVAVWTIFRDITVLGMELLAGGIFLFVFLGIPLLAGELLIFVLVIAYTWRGGFKSTNAVFQFQAIMIIIGTVILLVTSASLAGDRWLPGNPALDSNGLSQLIGVPGLFAADDYLNFGFGASDWQWLIISNFMFYWLWFPYWQQMYSARSVRAAQRGFGLGQPFFGTIILLPAVAGICIGQILTISDVAALGLNYPGLADWPGDAAGAMFMRDTMPLQFGGLGAILSIFMFAVVMGSNQSTLSGCAIAPATIIGHDFALKARGIKDDNTIQKWTRYSLIPLMVIGLIFANLGFSVLELLYLGNMTLAAGLWFPLVMGMVWKRANTKSAWISIVCVTTLTFVLYFIYRIWPFAAAKGAVFTPMVWDATTGAYIIDASALAVGQANSNVNAVLLGVVLSFLVMFIGGFIWKTGRTKGVKSIKEMRERATKAAKKK